MSVDSVVSEPQSLKYGVPQGSVLGPVLFSLYLSPIEDIIRSHGLDCTIFADDTQLYIVCNSRVDPSATPKIEACADEIRHWMRANMPSLNDGKTELIVFSSMFKKVGSTPSSVQVGDTTIHPSTSVRDLGVIFDEHGTLQAHVASLCRSASHALWRIGKIRKLLDLQMTEKLVHAFVTSRLDYCNSLLFGLPAKQVRKLQLIQNLLRGWQTLTKKCDHITPVLQSLHWLPVEQRIRFKLLCITFKVLHDSQAPVYLSELVNRKVPARALRYYDEVKLARPGKEIGKTLVFYGDRAFAVCAPRLWNDLPDAIRGALSLNSFKALLKTHLFRQHYFKN